MPRLRFLFVGDGQWRERFENRARALGLEKHFIFTGLVAPQKVPALVGIMDIIAHLSLREGLPRALPQALASGKPVVAYDCDGAREVCLENQTGYLIGPGDLSTLEARLLALARDPNLRTSFGLTGQKLVKERFSVERMVDDLYQLYQRLSRTAPVTAPIER